MKSPGRFVAMLLLGLASVQILFAAAIGDAAGLSPAVKSDADELSSDDWQKAIGKWRNKAGTLLFELIDMNKADREYHPDAPIKVEGYVRKVPSTWSEKINTGNLIFISNEVQGDTIVGKWIAGAHKGDCPKLSLDFSSCSLKIGKAGDTLTSQLESKQYLYPKCEWSDEVKPETFTYYRVR
jgi:hypothetical protein